MTKKLILGLSIASVLLLAGIAAAWEKPSVSHIAASSGGILPCADCSKNGETLSATRLTPGLRRWSISLAPVFRNCKIECRSVCMRVDPNTGHCLEWYTRCDVQCESSDSQN